MSLYFNVWYSIGWYLNVGILMGVIFFTQYSNDYILIRAHPLSSLSLPSLSLSFPLPPSYVPPSLLSTVRIVILPGFDTKIIVLLTGDITVYLKSN